MKCNQQHGPHTSRRAALLLGAVVCTCLAAAAPPTSGLSLPEILRLAESRFRTNDLLEAEKLFRRALPDAEGEGRVQCFERLLSIYARLGRTERAIQVGHRYQDLLRQGGNVRRLRDLESHLGECYLTLGHDRTAETHLEQSLRGGELPPLKRLTVLTHLARSSERRDDRARAGRFWEQVERVAVEQLERAEPPLPAAERIAVVWRLVDSYRFRRRPTEAIARLVPLLKLHDELRDKHGKRDTLRRLAGHHAALGAYDRAEKYLKQALALHGRKDDSILEGDLADELAAALDGQDRPAEARNWRERAVRAYNSALDNSAGADISRLLTAFWKLQKLYQRTDRYSDALLLAQTQTGQWSDRLLPEPRLASEEGALQVVLGSFDRARAPLRRAVAELGRQDPVNLIDLPRAMVNLAIVEQSTGDLDRAEKLARDCQALHRRHHLPNGLLLVETHNVLGSCTAERGQYARAIEHFRAGITLCERIGTSANPPHSNLLLNIALLHKSQGDTAEALHVLDRALKVYRTFAADGALGFAAFAAAQANMDAARGKVAEAYAQVPRILDVCRKHKIEGGQWLVTAYHCEGLFRLQNRKFDAAAKAWRKVLAIQEKEKMTLLVPRTLNYLGMTEELGGRPKQAETFYRQALALQQAGKRALPVTHFISLWRLAGLVEQAGQTRKARDLLEQAVGVVEAARQETYGDATQRAGFFAQFEPGLDRLVELCLRDGDVEAAFAAAVRGRSRTLLDQLRLAGVNPRTAVRGERGDELRRSEQELVRRISGLRARAQLIPVEAVGGEQGRAVLAALDKAQREYAAVWREYVNAHALYSNLAAEDPSRALTPARREKLLGPRTLLLVYHVGRDRSHLLLLGGRNFRPEAFPLIVPAGLDGKVAPPPTQPADVAMARPRDLVWSRRKKKITPAPGPAPSGPAVPLGRDLARSLVDHYCLDISDPDFHPGARDFVLTPRDPSRPLPARSPRLLADVLLPAAVRKRIADHRAECLVVVPDGPLHKLPLEALVLEIGARPRYAVDELPPIIYAPSAAALPLLSARVRTRPPERLSLLTACNPVYPKTKAVREVVRAEQVPIRPIAFQGQLRELPGTAEESRRIRKFFDRARVTALEGKDATEAAVAAAVAGKHIVHIAAHGFADPEFGNLFGALALTPPPPGKETAGDDGFLSLHEVYALPLQDCELAVLSACVTNAGPQRPLEAGVTLASAFLEAGARRVVASHWGADDDATAVLMASFFEEVTKTPPGTRVAYARALQRARLKVRDTRGWSTPYYWAPFVLIGPAEGKD